MRTEAEANRALELYADTVRRICYLHLKNYADAEDVFQEVFLKYVLRKQPFESDAHEKAWLIRVALNACKDTLKSFFRARVRSFEVMTSEPFIFPEEEKETLNAILKLPPKYRDVICLFYCEGYTAVEIAKMLNKNVNTIYTWLDRARSALKARLGGDPVG